MEETRDVELSYKMLRDVEGYKSIEEIGSILESLYQDDVEEIIIKDLPFEVKSDVVYYLENVSILDRKKQEYVIDKNTEKVYGIYLVTYNKSKDLFGMVYVSENQVFTIFETKYADIDMKSTKFFSAFDENDECVAQVYDNGEEFIDVSKAYAHELFRLGVYEFTSMNLFEDIEGDAMFLYVSVMDKDENNDEQESESFLLRDKTEVHNFFSQIKEDVSSDERYTTVLNEMEGVLTDLLYA